MNGTLHGNLSRHVLLSSRGSLCYAMIVHRSVLTSDLQWLQWEKDYIDVNNFVTSQKIRGNTCPHIFEYKTGILS